MRFLINDGALRLVAGALVLAFFLYEEEDPSGLLKTCHYESPYGRVAITVRVTEVCPVVLELDV